MYLIYGQPNCPWCIEALRLARKKGVEFDYINLDEDEPAREFMKRMSHTTVPQIYFWVPGFHRQVGGFEEFAAELDDT